MGFGALRLLVRPLARAVVSTNTTAFSPATLRSTWASPATEFRSVLSYFKQQQPWICSRSNEFHSLTDTRFPKRRPGFKNRRKRASLKPPGPYAWVQYTPGQPILANNPNEGSVKRRNEKKRMRQKRAFIMSEKKKRKVQLQEANRKKIIKRVERKMAAVARDRAWTQRLAELQQLEAEKAAAKAAEA